MKNTIICPLCDATAVGSFIPPTHSSTPNIEQSTFIWVCEACPFIGFEFVDDQDAQDVACHLTERKGKEYGNIECQCGNRFYGLEGKEDTCQPCLKKLIQDEEIEDEGGHGTHGMYPSGE